MKFQIKEVLTKAEEQAFIKLPVKLYKQYKNWIRPLDDDVIKVFDRKRNKHFRQGDAARWLLYDGNNLIGRIAAFYDKKTANKQNNQPTGGIGFFECIDNQEAANLLFDTAKKWLEAQGMEAMDGPINFGDRNENWGLLVEGDIPPNYGMPYHPKYYQNLFENYGFQVYFKQLTYYKDLSKDREALHEKVVNRAQRFLEDKDYTFKHIDLKHLAKYAEDFRVIYNKGWAKFTGVGQMSQAQVKVIMNSLKQIIDPTAFWFGYYKDEPIAMFLMIPDINQIVKHLNGKLNWWGKLKFLYYKKTGAISKLVGTIFGVVPEFQKKGMEAAIIMAFSNFVDSKKNYSYKDLEMNWIGDFNPKMMRTVELIGGKVLKTHHTYRYLFDREKPFKRMELMM